MTGITIRKANTTGSFGNTDVRDSASWAFDPLHPLIGIYGYSDEDGITGMSFITYDLESDCQSYVPPPPPPIEDDVVTDEG